MVHLRNPRRAGGWGRGATAAGVVLGLLTAIGAACSSDEGPVRRATLAEFGSSLQADLDAWPLESPVATAQAADVVVRGALVGVREGESRLAGRYHAVVLEIRPSAFLKGRLPAGSDGTLYLEIAARGDDTAVRVRDALPDNIEVQAALRSDGSRDASDRDDGGAGAPDGEPVWNAFLPGGLILRAGSELFVPYGAWETDGLTFEDFGPDRLTWPPFVYEP